MTNLRTWLLEEQGLVRFLQTPLNAAVLDTARHGQSDIV